MILPISFVCLFSFNIECCQHCYEDFMLYNLLDLHCNPFEEWSKMPNLKFKYGTIELLNQTSLIFFVSFVRYLALWEGFCDPV